MNDAIFWRLVWKEYRLQRAFWLSIAAMTIAAQLLTVVFAAGEERLTWLFGLALGFSALYALGCGATLFATEHEVGTFEFQRTLPVSSRRLFAGKLLFALLSIPALMAILWLAAVTLAGGRVPALREQAAAWGLWGFAAVELLVWGVLFSLLTTQPLKAAILGIAAASAAIHLITANFIAADVTRYWDAETYAAALPARAVVAALVALVDLAIGLRWLRLPGSRQRLAGPSTGERTAAAHPRAGVASGRRGGTAALLWQHWRQSARTMAVVAGAAVLVAWLTLWAMTTLGWADEYRLLVSAAILIGAMFGVGTFLADQQQHGFRFFAEHGVRPRRVWFTRQLLWSLPLVPLAVLGVLAVLTISPHPNDHNWWLVYGDQYQSWGMARFPWLTAIGRAARLVGIVAVAYSAAQFSSMLFRSGFLAGFFAILFSSLLGGWALLMMELGVPWIWSVLPIPLVLLLATFVHSSDWMLERHTGRAWLKFAMIVGLPLAAIAVYVPLHRAHEIPANPRLAAALADYTRPVAAAEKDTLELYRRAWEAYRPREKIDVPGLPATGDRELTAKEQAKRSAAYLSANEEALRLTLQASRQQADFFTPSGDDTLLRRVSDLARLVVDSGGAIQAEGRLDEALDLYLAAIRISRQLRQRASTFIYADRVEQYASQVLVQWAAAGDQSPEWIKRAIDAYQEHSQDLPPAHEVLKSQWVIFHRAIEADPEAIETLTGVRSSDRLAAREYVDTIVRQAVLFDRLAPWEVTRARRAVDHQTAEALFRNTDPGFAYPAAAPDRRWYEYRRTTPLLSDFDWQSAKELTAGALQAETRRRATLVLLALEAWKAEHGELPESLDPLVGTYLEELPVDPYRDEPFEYVPKGLPLALEPSPYHYQAVFYLVVAANQPFLWSSGPILHPQDPDAADFHRKYVIYSGENWTAWNSYRWPRSEYEVWQAGWPFEIP